MAKGTEISVTIQQEIWPLQKSANKWTCQQIEIYLLVGKFIYLTFQ